MFKFRYPIEELVVPSGERGEHLLQDPSGKFAVLLRHVSGRQVRKTVDAYDKETALKLRDEVFDYVREHGGKIKPYDNKQPLSARVRVHPDLYIYKIKPFAVRYGGEYIGAADTIEEARIIRDRWIRRREAALHEPAPKKKKRNNKPSQPRQ